MEQIKLSQKAVSETRKIIAAGGVVVFPTDTVYGFLADANNKKAVEKIYKIKKRPKSKPLAVFVKDLKMASELAEIDAKQKKILKSKWPGKYTFVLPFAVIPAQAGIQSVSSLIIKDNKIALRIPKYKFLNSLLKKMNKPVAQTSVNISGNLSMTKIGDIIEQFGKQDILIINAGSLKNLSHQK